MTVTVKPTTLGFERPYSDGSGVQFSVTYKGKDVVFDHVTTAEFPVEEIPWLIECLRQIQAVCEEAK